MGGNRREEKATKYVFIWIDFVSSRHRHGEKVLAHLDNPLFDFLSLFFWSFFTIFLVSSFWPFFRLGFG